MGNTAIRRCFIKDLLIPPESPHKDVNMLLESAFVQYHSKQ